MVQLESKSWCLSLSHRVKVHSLIDFYGLVDLFMYISMYDFDLSLLKSGLKRSMTKYITIL